MRHINLSIRKTGITLKDTGVRDEHGLEPVSGIFSSSPAISVQHNLDHALEDEDDEMDVEESRWTEITTSSGRVMS
jgi:centromere protein C